MRKKLYSIIAFVVSITLNTEAQNGVSINTTGAVANSSAMLDISSTTSGLLIPRMTTLERNAIAGAAQGLQIFNTTTNCIEIFSGILWHTTGLCACTSAPPTLQGGNSISSSNYIMWFWNNIPNASGYKWNSTNDYNSAIDLGLNTFYVQTGLNSNTPYSSYIWAYNTCGNSQSILLHQSTSVWTCGNDFSLNHIAGNIAPVSKAVTYKTIQTNITGSEKCWLAQNLGADYKASSVTNNTEPPAGWYWQFNRKQGYKHDGNLITPTWTITSIDENSEWLKANDPCNLLLGSGWRIPTKTEWENTTLIWTSSLDAYASDLKLHNAGTISSNGSSLFWRGTGGWYWSSTQKNNTQCYSYAFSAGYSIISTDPKSPGSSIRCIKD